MTIFIDIASQHAIADAPFASAEQNAFDVNDDAAFDLASTRRRHNDQAYFLYMFTRFEREVNDAVRTLLAARITGQAWLDRRIWQAWSRIDVEDIHFLSKVEVLIDKSLAEYQDVQRFYKARNKVGHGDELEEQYVIQQVAQRLHTIAGAFATA